MRKLAFLSAQTTGPNPQLHQLWELSFIIREPGAPRDSDQEHFFQFAPSGLKHADPATLQVSGFWTHVEPELLRQLAMGTPSPELTVARSLTVAVDEDESAWTFISHRTATSEIVALLANAIVVGRTPDYVVSHRDGFLTSYVTAHGFPASWHPRSISAFALAYGYLLCADEINRVAGGVTPERLAPNMSSSALFTRLLGRIPAQTGSLAMARTVRDVWDFVN